MCKSSCEAEYRAGLTTSELIWIKGLIKEFDLIIDDPIDMHYDNQPVIFIANNSAFHKKTKHEADCHFVKNAISGNEIITRYTRFEEQLADMFTKALSSTRFHKLCTKLGIIDTFAPACGGVLRTLFISVVSFGYFLCTRFLTWNPKLL